MLAGAHLELTMSCQGCIAGYFGDIPGSENGRGNYLRVRRKLKVVVSPYHAQGCYLLCFDTIRYRYGFRGNQRLRYQSLICAMQIRSAEAYLGLTSSLPFYSQIQIAAAGEPAVWRSNVARFGRSCLPDARAHGRTTPQLPFSCATSPQVSFLLLNLNPLST